MKSLHLSLVEKAVTLITLTTGGGPTHWGITLTTARANGYMGDMRNLTRNQALKILEADYWYGPRLDQVAIISHSIAAELCDTGVNMGPSIPIKYFQRWLNVFNDQQKNLSGFDSRWSDWATDAFGTNIFSLSPER